MNLLTITNEVLKIKNVSIKCVRILDIVPDDENNQKRLRDLENGQCLLQDLYGRVGVVQIHPVFEELLHAFDTRPPVKSEVE